MTDPNLNYWDEYSNLQHTKHKIIKNYLNGWFPKLGYWSGRILYVDTHAGKGKHKTGEEGSPIVALKTILDHQARDRILKKCEVRMFFIEDKKENAVMLEQELDGFKNCHPKIHWSVINSDSFKLLEDLIHEFEREGHKLAPSFIFVDPYGFKIPYPLLKKIKAQPKSELLINIIWREFDMAMRNPAMEKSLNELFGTEEWQDIRQIENPEERGEMTIQFLHRLLGARWATYIRMIGNNNRTRYYLLHLTDNEAGRDLMKDVVWLCCPDGGYYARKQDNPRQQYLIEPEPDLRPLENWILDKLKVREYTFNELTELLRDEIWRTTHLWKILKEQKDNNKIIADKFEGRFSQKSNPTFRRIEQ